MFLQIWFSFGVWKSGKEQSLKYPSDDRFIVKLVLN